MPKIYEGEKRLIFFVTVSTTSTTRRVELYGSIYHKLKVHIFYTRVNVYSNHLTHKYLIAITTIRDRSPWDS